jgi:hypothetical protein
MALWVDCASTVLKLIRFLAIGVGRRLTAAPRPAKAFKAYPAARVTEGGEMTQASFSITRLAMPPLAFAIIGCSVVADGNEPVSSLQRIAAAGNLPSRVISLQSAPEGLAEGAVVNRPSIVAINGVTLPEMKPSVVTHTESWGTPFGGASYVSSCPDCGSTIARCDGGFTPEAPASISFLDTFELPEGFSTPAFSMTTTNDDAANVYLNGVQIGRAQTCCGSAPGQLVLRLRTEDQSVFRVGSNELRYDLENLNAPCPLSMAYVATVAFQVAEQAP